MSTRALIAAQAPLSRGQTREAGTSTGARTPAHNSHPALLLQRLLKQQRWTMSRLSAETKKHFGGDGHYFIPKTLLYKQKVGVTPHICQLVALSEVTGYRFADWMEIFGFDLRLILELQLRIQSKRTTLLATGGDVVGDNGAFAREGVRQERRQARYCYAKIGSRDAVLYPAVRPGCIVRADRFYSPEILHSSRSAEHFWLVQHPGGTTCCRVKMTRNNEVLLLPDHPPLSAWPLPSKHVCIMGLVDSQERAAREVKPEPLRSERDPDSLALALHAKPKKTFSELLRASRLRTGLTFREAHELTLQIREALQNRFFSISTSLLSDYEATNKVPRHIAKIISLCAIYGIDFWELLTAANINVRDSDKLALAVEGVMEQSRVCPTDRKSSGSVAFEASDNEANPSIERRIGA